MADHDTTAQLTVLQNDDPYGVFSFAALSREVSVVEDVLDPTSDDSLAATSKTLMVERGQGTFRTVHVVWEVFSYHVGGAGNLPEVWDLTFLAENVPDSVVERKDLRREGTGTAAMQFVGCDSKWRENGILTLLLCGNGRLIVLFVG